MNKQELLVRFYWQNLPEKCLNFLICRFKKCFTKTEPVNFEPKGKIFRKTAGSSG